MHIKRKKLRLTLSLSEAPAREFGWKKPLAWLLEPDNLLLSEGAYTSAVVAGELFYFLYL